MLTTLALAVVGVGVQATPAHAEVYDILENQALRTLCIDDSFEYGLRMFGCNGLAYQVWYTDASWPNPYAQTYFQNKATGRCLDDSAYGLRVIGCNGTVWQTWQPRRWDDGTWQFQNQGTGLCLDVDHNGFVGTGTCNATEWESWYRRQ